MKSTLLIGIGNDFRGDDGVGPLVARLVQEAAPANLTVLRQSGEGSALIEAWDGYNTAIVVDAATSGAKPGTVHRFEPLYEPLPAYFAASLSGHSFGLAGAIELARRLDRLPRCLIIYGVEAQTFEAGASVTPAVRQAARQLAAELRLSLA